MNTALCAVCAILWLSLANIASAQSLVPDTPLTIDVPAVEIAGIDVTGWSGLAARAEGLASNSTVSRFALTRIRAELVNWRDKFSTALDVNEDRLETVATQIAALGDVGDASGSAVTARLAALEAQKLRLSQPKLLAQEAFARANGLITEIDRRQWDIETERLMTRSASPANPAHWPAAFASAQQTVGNISTEIWELGVAHHSNGDLLSRIVRVVTALIVIGFVLIRARAASARFFAQPLDISPRLSAVLRFGLSLGDIVLPLLALFLAMTVLRISGLFGVTSEALIGTVTYAGALIFGAKWLSGFYFPTSADDDGILGYGQGIRLPARKVSMGLGWALALSVVLAAFVAVSEASSVSTDVLNLPVQLLIGFLLWRLGRLVANHARADTTAIFTRSRLRVFIGRAAQAFAIAGPLASVLGYGAAAAAITIPAVISLAIIAVIVVLQQLSYAVATPAVVVEDAAEDSGDPLGLLPILISFGLAVLGLPVLALVWGVSGAELVELWTRFLVGFQIGETQISPSNFLTFILVFMVGVLVTRFIKTTLKTTVMPRTHFDLGGRNAVVAGFGYVGIFLSALVAFGVAGIDLSSLAIVAGALSVGIGFGLQNIVSNFVSGIILLIERPVGEGDMIEVGGQMGYVRDISVRSTRIETFDRTDVIIPNADLVSNQVTNWTRGNLVGRAILPVGVAYGTDTAKVTEILQQIAEEHPMVLVNPAPTVLLIGFGADSIDFEIRAIIRDVNFVMVVKSEIFQSIVERFDAEGIEIPFAQRDIWLRNPEVLSPKGADT